MGTFVQLVSNQDLAIKACGRACASMDPTSRPELPAIAPLSFSQILREHPEVEFEVEWLDALDTSPTIH